MNEEVRLETVHIHSRADELIACLEGEIAKREEELAACRVAVENCEVFRARIVELEARIVWLECEAQGDAWAPSGNDYDHSIHSNPDAREWADFFVATFPGLADKHDLMIGWFANAMMAMHDHLARKAQGVVMPDGWIPLTIEHEPGYPEDVAFGPKRMMDRLKKWLDRYFEMRLKAAPAQQAKCRTCDDNGRIGGPSFYAPDEGGEPCPDCSAPVHQVSVPDERAAFEREDRYIVIKRSDMDRIPNQKVVHSFLGALGELSAHSVRIPQRKFLVIESDWPEYDPAWKLIQDRVQGRPILDAAPAAPAADALLVEALETIINPIEAMRRELQVGEQLNGMVAMQLASDPEYLRGVAKAAIAAHRAKGVM